MLRLAPQWTLQTSHKFQRKRVISDFQLVWKTVRQVVTITASRAAEFKFSLTLAFDSAHYFAAESRTDTVICVWLIRWTQAVFSSPFNQRLSIISAPLRVSSTPTGDTRCATHLVGCSCIRRQLGAVFPLFAHKWESWFRLASDSDAAEVKDTLLGHFNLSCCVRFGLIFTVASHFNIIQQFSHFLFSGFSRQNCIFHPSVSVFIFLQSSLNISFLFKTVLFFFFLIFCLQRWISQVSSAISNLLQQSFRFLSRHTNQTCVSQKRHSLQLISAQSDWLLCVSPQSQKPSRWCSFVKHRHKQNSWCAAHLHTQINIFQFWLWEWSLDSEGWPSALTSWHVKETWKSKLFHPRFLTVTSDMPFFSHSVYLCQSMT